MSTTWDHDYGGERRASVLMTPHQDVLGFIYPGRQIRRPAKIWMKLFHQIAVSARNVRRRGATLETENFVSLVFRNRARTTRVALARAETPRVRVRIACRTPSGKSAVKISL